METGENHHHARDRIADQTKARNSNDSPEPQKRAALNDRRRRRIILRSKIMHHLFAHRPNRALAQISDSARPTKKFEHPRSRCARALNLLHLELLSPRNHRSPYQLIDQHNHCNHRADAERYRARVPIVSRGLQIRAQSRKPEVRELFASHQKKPRARDRHHRIPNQSDGSVGQFNLKKTLPPVEAIDSRRFPHLPRNALERSIKTERNVPDLSGKNK